MIPINPKSILLGVVLFTLAGVLLLILYAWGLRREASGLLDDLTALNVGTASAADAERIAQHHRNSLANQNCQTVTCEYTFIITNRWLSELHFEPDTSFRAGITVQNGIVIRVGAGLLRSMDIYPTFNASAGSVEEYAEMPERYRQMGHYGFPTPVGKPYLKVVLDSHADAVQKQHAFAFSFRCLTKPGGGCDLSCDYLPLAWKDWRTGLQPIFPNFDGVYPGSERCR
jgi:hypothetical protein